MSYGGLWIQRLGLIQDIFPYFLYIGHLNKDVKEQDLMVLFGFNATTYLQENCRVDLPTGKNGKNKGFGFAVMSEHV